jgi:hypothetical protein
MTLCSLFCARRAKYEEEYLLSMTRSSAQEFQDELKKLGVYEGD